jgi:hypothetical protein
MIKLQVVAQPKLGKSEAQGELVVPFGQMVEVASQVDGAAAHINLAERVADVDHAHHAHAFHPLVPLGVQLPHVVRRDRMNHALARQGFGVPVGPHPVPGLHVVVYAPRRGRLEARNRGVVLQFHPDCPRPPAFRAGPHPVDGIGYLG